MAVAEADPQAEHADFEYPNTVEDAGPATKKVHVTVPADRIKSLFNDQLGLLQADAQLPGFRRGKAPAGVLRKRFGDALKSETTNQVVRESYEQAIKSNDLKVIGDPDFGDQQIQLPDDGDLEYSFTVETVPEFDLPDPSQAKIDKPKVEITDEHVDQAMQNLREQQGTLVPVEDRGVQEKDYVMGDVTVKHGDEVLTEQKDANLVARPGRVYGVQVDDLAEKLAGAKADETVSFKITLPDTHPKQELRGKEVDVELKVHEIKQLELAEINEAFLEELEFDDEAALRQALREQMEERVDMDVKQAMRQQMSQFLLDSVTLDLPKKLSERQAQQVVQRRAQSLMQRGVAPQNLQANLDKLKEGADEDARKELTAFFVTNRFAEEHDVQVDEAEINGRIAMMAMEQGQRPEALRDHLIKTGQVQQLAMSMREQATLDKLIESAQVTEVDPKAGEAGDGKKAADDATGHGTDVAPADDDDVS